MAARATTGPNQMDLVDDSPNGTARQRFYRHLPGLFLPPCQSEGADSRAAIDRQASLGGSLGFRFSGRGASR